MRKLTVCLLALSAMGLGACEDGPTQVYDPSPEGAGDRWNDGKTGGTVDPAKAGFNADVGGGSKQEICTGSEKSKRWSKMIGEDIKPPRFMAGLAGGPIVHTPEARLLIIERDRSPSI